MNTDEACYVKLLLMELVDNGLLTYEEAMESIGVYMEDNKKATDGTAAA